MMRLLKKVAYGLVPMGPMSYRKPQRELENRDVVSRRIPAQLVAPVNLMIGAGIVHGTYGRTQKPYLANAVPTVVGATIYGAGFNVGGSRLGGLSPASKRGN